MFYDLLLITMTHARIDYCMKTFLYAKLVDLTTVTEVKERMTKLLLCHTGPQHGDTDISLMQSGSENDHLSSVNRKIVKEKECFLKKASSKRAHGADQGK